MQPEEIIGEIKRSGLRGRGGGGFPTGMKWESCRNAPSPAGVRYIICNADEGDPGAYMDRSLLEGNPHSIIEGMIIGACAIESHHGYVYVRHEYPLAVENLGIALQQAREYGLLGEDIIGILSLCRRSAPDPARCLGELGSHPEYCNVLMDALVDTFNKVSSVNPMLVIGCIPDGVNQAGWDVVFLKQCIDFSSGMVADPIAGYAV